jgi:hypothetical protein
MTISTPITTKLQVTSPNEIDAALERDSGAAGAYDSCRLVAYANGGMPCAIC